MNITFLIKTFERPDDCHRLIKSVLDKYPGKPIHVFDDSATPTDWTSHYKDVLTITGEYDTGISEARNRLIESAKTEYFMMLDDDYIFNQDTDVECLIRVLNKGYDFVCGTVNNVFSFKWCGNISIEPNRDLRISKRVNWNYDGKDTWVDVDAAPNVFVGRSNTKHRYDPQWKIGAEHIDWATRAKWNGFKTAYVPYVSVRHTQSRPVGYRKMRSRGQAFNKQWRKAHNVRRFAVDTLPMHNRKPIFVITPGSTGSRMLTDFYEIQGWQCPGKDEFGESPAHRDFNRLIGKNQKPDLRKFVQTLPVAWILKDPYMSYTPHVWDYWKPYLESIQATVILNMRGRITHNASMKKRWRISSTESQNRRTNCRLQYDSYMGPKHQIDYEHMQRICQLWSR